MKKEIIIDGSASDWFEKATFVLKETHVNAMPKDLMNYAEEIVENHMKKIPRTEEEILQPVDFSYRSPNEYERARIAYEKQMKLACDKLKKEREKLKKRSRYINIFIALSVSACLLSFIALALSSIG